MLYVFSYSKISIANVHGDITIEGYQYCICLVTVRSSLLMYMVILQLRDISTVCV